MLKSSAEKRANIQSKDMEMMIKMILCMSVLALLMVGWVRDGFTDGTAREILDFQKLTDDVLEAERTARFHRLNYGIFPLMRTRLLY
jgi:hypothetical protein